MKYRKLFVVFALCLFTTNVYAQGNCDCHWETEVEPPSCQVSDDFCDEGYHPECNEIGPEECSCNCVPNVTNTPTNTPTSTEISEDTPTCTFVATPTIDCDSDTYDDGFEDCVGDLVSCDWDVCLYNEHSFAELDESNPRSGNNCALLKSGPGGSGTVGISNVYAVKPGGTYTVTAWVYIDEWTSWFFDADALFGDADCNECECGYSSIGTVKISSQISVFDQYVQVTICEDKTINTSVACLSFLFQSGTSNTFIYIDDIEITETSYISCTPTSNIPDTPTTTNTPISTLMPIETFTPLITWTPAPSATLACTEIPATFAPSCEGWTFCGAVYCNSMLGYCMDSANCIVFEDYRGPAFRLYQVVPGIEYTLSFYARIQGSCGMFGNGITFYACFSSVDGADHTCESVLAACVSDTPIIFDTCDLIDWTKYTKTVTSSTGWVIVAFRTEGSGTVRIDNVAITADCAEDTPIPTSTPPKVPTQHSFVGQRLTYVGDAVDYILSDYRGDYLQKRPELDFWLENVRPWENIISYYYHVDGASHFASFQHFNVDSVIDEASPYTDLRLYFHSTQDVGTHMPMRARYRPKDWTTPTPMFPGPDQTPINTPPNTPTPF